MFCADGVVAPVNYFYNAPQNALQNPKILRISIFGSFKGAAGGRVTIFPSAVAAQRNAIHFNSH